jgi:hypothetical protein
MGAEKACKPKRACCMVSEMLEEAGLDRPTLRRLRRQVLEGMILLCQWQLERIPPDEGRAASRSRRTRKVEVQ